MIGDAKANTAARFSIWRLPGRKQICHDGAQLHLACASAAGTRRLTWPSDLADGDPFAFVIPSGLDLRMQWSLVSGYTETLKAAFPVRQVAQVFRPSRSSLLHLRMLQALDGSLAGASHRDIATTLFGKRAVTRRWYADSELRAQVRHLIRKGRALMSGDYRRLLQSSPKGEGDSGHSTISP